MLDALITSKTRVRLLVKFFLNPTMKAYLRQLADEFGESTNAVRVELNRLKEAGLLESGPSFSPLRARWAAWSSTSSGCRSRQTFHTPAAAVSEPAERPAPLWTTS